MPMALSPAKSSSAASITPMTNEQRSAQLEELPGPACDVLLTSTADLVLPANIGGSEAGGEEERAEELAVAAWLRSGAGCALDATALVGSALGPASVLAIEGVSDAWATGAALPYSRAGRLLLRTARDAAAAAASSQGAGEPVDAGKVLRAIEESGLASRMAAAPCLHPVGVSVAQMSRALCLGDDTGECARNARQAARAEAAAVARGTAAGAAYGPPGADGTGPQAQQTDECWRFVGSALQVVSAPADCLRQGWSGGPPAPASWGAAARAAVRSLRRLRPVLHGSLTSNLGLSSQPNCLRPNRLSGTVVATVPWDIAMPWLKLRPASEAVYGQGAFVGVWPAEQAAEALRSADCRVLQIADMAELAAAQLAARGDDPAARHLVALAQVFRDPVLARFAQD